MIPIVRGQGGTSEPSGAAARLDREAAARVLATLSSKTNTDESLGSLLEDAFSVALLDALSRIPALPARPAVVEAPRPPADSGSTRIGVTPGEATSLPAPAPAPTVPRARGSGSSRRRPGLPSTPASSRRCGAQRTAGRDASSACCPCPRRRTRIRRDGRRRASGATSRREAGRPSIPRRGDTPTSSFASSRTGTCPVGAGNDPTGLNQHHAARNLIRLYAQIAAKSHGPNPAS
jgi:hypothetical protein